MFDTARAALEQLTDEERFEQLVVAVLSARKFPDLRITGPSGDKGQDAFSRELFHDQVDVALMVSLQKTWTRKLKTELDKIEKRPVGQRPAKAFFVTNQSTSSVNHDPYKRRAAKLGTLLEVFDLNELVQSLERDDLRPVAEAMLGVRPRVPRALVPPLTYLEKLGQTVAGVGAPLVSRGDQSQFLVDVFADPAADAPRVVLLDGQGGVGKTRLVVEAADRSAVTLVVPTGARLSATELSLVPLNSPAVLVIDDAHRCPDLSGISVMFNDRRYDDVKVAFICRQGTTGAVLHDSGIEKFPRVGLTLEPLTNSDIETIVRGHGLDDAGFIKTVIDVSGGSPLIAHEICEHVVRHGQISWPDVSDILEHLVNHRLLTRAADPEPKRAVAVALAVLGSVGQASDIVALQGAVGRLPQSLDTIDAYLWELADSGVAATTPQANGTTTFTLSPHLLAHVLVSTSMVSGARVKVDVQRTLGVLGRAACQTSFGSEGLFGVAPLSSETHLPTRPLAGQLEVMAQAASRKGNTEVGGLLARAVYELLPARPSFADWETVFALAGPVATAAPNLINDLRASLQRSWPPVEVEASSWWSDTDPNAVRATELRHFVEHAATLTTRSGYANPAGAVKLLLTAAVLAQTALGTYDLGRVEKAVDQIAHPTRGNLSGTLDRRIQVLDAVVDWTKGASTPSSDVTLATVDPATWARVSVAALKPFLEPMFETTPLGFANGTDVVLFGATVLPDDPRLASCTITAADAIADVIGQADFSTDSGAAGSFTRSLIKLPHELRLVGQRGLSGSSGPLPTYATKLLDAAGQKITAGLVGRWPDLPLAARHDAAHRCVSQRGAKRTYRSLAQRAAAGEQIAKLAVNDPELVPLLILVPVDIDDRDMDESTPAWKRAEHRRHTAAKRFATSLTWQDGIDLLARTAPLDDNPLGVPARHAFVEELAARVPETDVDQLVETLRAFDDPLPQERTLIEALLSARGTDVLAALTRHATTPRGGELLLHTFSAVDDAAKADISAVLLKLIDPVHPPAVDAVDDKQAAARAQSPSSRVVRRLGAGLMTGAANALGRGSNKIWRLGRRLPVTAKVFDAFTDAEKAGSTATEAPAPPEVDAGAAARSKRLFEQTRLAENFAYQVLWAADWADGPSMLVKIGLTCPDAAVVTAVRVLGVSRNQTSRQPLTREQWEATVPVLRRRLESKAEYGSGLLDDYDTGRLIQVLTVQVPDALAEVLADLLTRAENDHLRWAAAWRQTMSELSPAQRTPLAHSLTRHITPHAALLPDHVRFDLDQTVAEIAAGTSNWEADLLTLAAGAASDKERAIAAVANLWREPAWGRVVATLLRSGLDSGQTEVLIQGIDVTTFGYDDAEQIEDRRTALRRVPSQDDSAVAAFVARANSQIDQSITMFENS